jgi:hypothetical protein
MEAVTAMEQSSLLFCGLLQQYQIKILARSQLRQGEQSSTITMSKSLSHRTSGKECSSVLSRIF